MHQIAGASPVYQRIKPPEWVFNNELRDVLLLYAENRLALFDNGVLHTYEQRVQRIREATIKRRKNNVRVIDDLCKRFVMIKNNGGSEADLKIMAQKIEELDTTIRVMDAGILETAAAVVYRFYKLREDSVAIGQALHMKPPMVRQLLSRIRILAQRGPRKVAPWVEKGEWGCVRHICPICGKEFFITYSFHKYCGVPCRKRHAAEARQRRALVCPSCRKQLQPKSRFQFIHQFSR